MRLDSEACRAYGSGAQVVSTCQGSVLPRFHYTTKGNFYAICNAAYVTPELWSALKAADGDLVQKCAESQMKRPESR